MKNPEETHSTIENSDDHQHEPHVEILEHLSSIAIRIVDFLNKNLPPLFAEGYDWWSANVIGKLSFDQKKEARKNRATKFGELDLACLLTVLTGNWRLLSSNHDLGLDKEGLNHADEMRSVRNRWSHIKAQKSPSPRDIERDLDTMRRFAAAIGADDTVINKIEKTYNDFRTAELSKSQIVNTASLAQQIPQITTLQSPASVLQQAPVAPVATSAQPFQYNDEVEHSQFGRGRVQAVLPDNMVVVRFDGEKIEICPLSALTPVISAEAALAHNIASPVGRVLLRLLANSISSCNDAWGVFSPSSIDLLPHQLWVCRKVLESWPFHWLIADDVGMGKTIEAGIILWPLIARKTVRRLLVIAPASIAVQWQERMRRMFDIRMQIYTQETDSAKSDFWGANELYVSASIHTLRKDSKGRHARLFNAPKWDLIIVDEAHHLNKEETGNVSLNYKLLSELRERTQSLLFFTGTPHRGKNHNFFALLKLLRPDIFDPRLSPDMQFKRLGEVMIRNNKQAARDLNGELIFRESRVSPRKYDYSTEEAIFYEMLTKFILSGRAYARTLEMQESRAVMLVLTVLQKLASSSVAAIKHALEKRLEKISAIAKSVQPDKYTGINNYTEADDDDFEAQNKQDEELFEKILFLLIENERCALEELISAAEKITVETKITEILQYVRSLPEGTTILFFTEYKATQSLLLSALMREYGKDTVTFINGDHSLDSVLQPDGTREKMDRNREQAAEDFNYGRKRFLVSTEAAGESIDLQENCHHIVHVDLPWNPMRLHQRVGRLYRYGQKFPVEITLFYNSETADGRIWELLTEKIREINRSYDATMEEPEDVSSLVLGMTSPNTFNSLYSGALDKSGESLRNWFDSVTSTFGGVDTLETVKKLIGNAQRFNYQNTVDIIPRLDLPDLQPFFETMLRLNHRQIRRDAETTAISFKTPDEWTKFPGITAGNQENILFARKEPKRGKFRITGVGSPLVNQALADAKSGEDALLGCLTVDNKTASDTFVFEVQDKITGKASSNVKKIVCGVSVDADCQPVFLTDASLIGHFNELLTKLLTKQFDEIGDIPQKSLPDINKIQEFVVNNLKQLYHPFEMPETRFVGAIVGASK